MFFILKKMTFFNMKIIGQAQYIITEPPILEFYFENRTSPTKRRGEIRKRINSFARFTPIPNYLLFSTYLTRSATVFISASVSTSTSNSSSMSLMIWKRSSESASSSSNEVSSVTSSFSLPSSSTIISCTFSNTFFSFN